MDKTPTYVIEMLHITKEFPGIKANDDITLQLKKGEIHALLGENGAGKSTLMSVLFGFSRFDVFPVDTWIKKAFESEYEGVSPEKMSDLLIEKYGENAGFVQQWAFYYKRAKKV